MWEGGQLVPLSSHVLQSSLWGFSRTPRPCSGCYLRRLFLRWLIFLPVSSFDGLPFHGSRLSSLDRWNVWLQAPHFSWSRRVRSLFDIFLLFLLLSIFWRRSSISWISEGPSSSILRSITVRRAVSLLFSAVKREASSFRNDLFSTSNVAIRPSIIAKAPGAGSILAPAVMDLAASLSIFTCVPLRLRDVSATLVTSEARRISSVLIFSARSVGSSGDPPVLLFFARGASTAGVSSSSLVSSVRRFPAFAVARKRVNGSRKFPLRL